MRDPAAVNGGVDRPLPLELERRARNWPGTKGAEGVWQKIISQMPPHSLYVEAFLGTGIVCRMKRPAPATIVMDADAAAPGFALCAGVPGLTAIVGDALQCLQKRRGELTADTLIYFDPPYLRSVRSCQRDYYRHEFASAAEHRRLLALLRKLPCMVMLSGYASALYDRELAGWRTVTIETVNHRGQRVTEWLWCNFPEPFELHDYRWLGSNWRERERIKKKKRRWLRRLQTMPALERAAVLAAIDEARSTTPATRAVAGEGVSQGQTL